VIKSRRMRWTGNVARTGARKDDFGFGEEHGGKETTWETTGVDEIILRWIIRKWYVRAWTGFSWLRIGTGGGHL
jgi:hypothetical protein